MEEHRRSRKDLVNSSIYHFSGEIWCGYREGGTQISTRQPPRRDSPVAEPARELATALLTSLRPLRPGSLQEPRPAPTSAQPPNFRPNVLRNLHRAPRPQSDSPGAGSSSTPIPIRQRSGYAPIRTMSDICHRPPKRARTYPTPPSTGP